VINDPYGSQTATNQPRALIMYNGQPLAGVKSATITNNNYYQCDYFSATLAVNAGPAGWYDVDPPMVLEIKLSLDGTSWTSLIVGEVDSQKIDLLNGTIVLEGRDLSSRLIETKTQQAYLNQTSSEVAATLAANHGMQTNIAQTTTLVGRYYQQDHSNITLDQFHKTTTEWDLLTYLARQEGFDVYMTGNTLNFQPSVPPNSNPFVLNWTPPTPVARLNAINLRMERSLTMAKDIVVQVKSWNSRQARSFIKTARAVGGKSSSASSSANGKASTAQTYVIVRPNLTEDQAQQLATRTAIAQTLHERILSVDMPGELTLTPRNMVALQGTGTSFDQSYFVASIDRHIAFDSGFTQSLRLKNSSPRTMTQV
jgi:phage protein D